MGELFLYQGKSIRRLACLRPLAQPGGDRVITEPWRMAVSAIHAMGHSNKQHPQIVAMLDRH